MFKKGWKNNKGFTLIELIVVIAIMAVLTAVLAPALLRYVEGSRMQKDDSAMGEVTNAIKLSLTDGEAFDELYDYNTFDNVSCYIDTITEGDSVKTVTKNNGDGTCQYTFGEEKRLADETPYTLAGNMRGVTITFEPNFADNNLTYDLGDAVINKYVGTPAKLSDCETLYGKLKSTIGETITLDSQTYENSEYTIFVRLSSPEDAVSVYGQYSGTNLSAEDVDYIAAIDRNNATPPGEEGDSETNTPSEGNKNDNQPETNGGNQTSDGSSSDLVGGGSVSNNGNTSNNTNQPNETPDNNTPSNTTTIIYRKEDLDPNITYVEVAATPGRLKPLFNNTIPNELFIPAAYKEGDTWYKITSVREESFDNYINLTHLVIPNTVTGIDANAFSRCSNLSSVTIPNSVTTLAVYAFAYCDSLTSIEIPDSVTFIGASCFNSCTNLQSIKLPANMTSISVCTFYGCPNLQTVTIPQSIASIGYMNFKNCTRLSEIKFTGTTAQWNNISKDVEWDNATADYVVHCTNGHILKDGTVINNTACPNCQAAPGRTFTIENDIYAYEMSGLESVSYQAEEGMTWAQLIEKEYSDNDALCINGFNNTVLGRVGPSLCDLRYKSTNGSVYVNELIIFDSDTYYWHYVD